MENLNREKWYTRRFLGLPVGGILTGALLLVLMQLVFYKLGGWWAGRPGQTVHILKWGALDDAVPMIRIFILPYIYSYIFWLVGLMVPSKAEKGFYFDWVVGSLIALTLGCLIFFLYPTYMDREAEDLYARAGTGLLGTLITFIYNADGHNMASCLFPSYHCLTSTLCLLGVWGRKEIHPAFRVFTLVMAVLICLATIFVKQHYLPDIFSGVALAALGFFVARKFHLGRGLAERV